MSDERQILSALIDREPVDADVLARVLEEPANRALLVDFVRLRAATDAGEPGAWEWRPPVGVAASPGRRGPAWWRAVAAVLLVAFGMGAGWWLSAHEAPPAPDRIVRFDRPLPATE
jgi:hypothetical protein